MRILLLGVLAWSSVAVADAKKDVDALVKKHVKGLAEPHTATLAETMVDNAWVVIPNGQRMEVGEIGDPVIVFYGQTARDASYKVAKLTINVDSTGTVAWFHGDVTGSYFMKIDPNEKPVKVSAGFRISGFAQSKTGWKIGAVMYTTPVSDKELFGQASKELTKPAAAKVPAGGAAEAIKTWFDGGLSKGVHSKYAATAVALGTSAAETGIGPGATKLAGAWEKIGMWLDRVEVKAFGNTSFAYAVVGLPVKGKGATKMVLGAVLHNDGGVWKWVMLAFSQATFREISED